MISLANSHDKAAVRDMWSICFGDSEEFMDLYFSEKYSSENTLLLFEDEKAVASLQMLPYQFSFYGEEIPVAYISGACTLPEYRNRGYMKKLLLRAFEIMQERNIPLSLLIPAEEWLYAYYSALGYEKVFESDNYPIPLKEIVERAKGNLDLAYQIFDKQFRTLDFCVQKTKSDFFTLFKSAEMDHFPQQTNLAGMARVIDADRLLAVFSKHQPGKNFSFALNDKFILKNSAFYSLFAGSLASERSVEGQAGAIDINTFTRLIFGFALEDTACELKSYFPAHKTYMNLMLE